MTTERRGRSVVIECDSCSETFGEDEEYSFSEVVEEAKSAGWRFMPELGKWTHRCPGCTKPKSARKGA